VRYGTSNDASRWSEREYDATAHVRLVRWEYQTLDERIRAATLLEHLHENLQQRGLEIGATLTREAIQLEQYWAICT